MHIRKKESERLSTAAAGRSVVVGQDRPTDSQISAVSKAIRESGICQKLKDSPSAALLERIAKKLNGCSPEALKIRIRARYDAITGLGMLEALAGDVAQEESEFASIRQLGLRCCVCSVEFQPEDGTIQGAHYACYEKETSGK